MKIDYKAITRLIGIIGCVRGYYLVLAQGKISVLHTVTVDDWTMYLIPLFPLVLAEACIISVKNSRKRKENT